MNSIGCGCRRDFPASGTDCGVGPFADDPNGNNCVYPCYLYTAENSPRGEVGTEGGVRIANPPLIDIRQTSGLVGQIILNASSNVAAATVSGDTYPWNAWKGNVIVGSENSTTVITLSDTATNALYKAPHYQLPSAMVGTGAVGVIPFRLYEYDCAPPQLVREQSTPALSNNSNVVFPADFTVGGGNAAEPVKIRFYGPIERPGSGFDDIRGAPLTSSATPPNAVCSPDWSDSANALFERRWPSSTATGQAARTLSLARAALNPGPVYAQIPPGLFRARIIGVASFDFAPAQPDVQYWPVCGTGLANVPKTAYYFRVDTTGGGGGCLCPADFNCSGIVSVQDLFDFLTAWFSNDPAADFNDSGIVSVQDIFDFLTAWFTGC